MRSFECQWLLLAPSQEDYLTEKSHVFEFDPFDKTRMEYLLAADLALYIVSMWGAPKM